jgi:hypothetical protein
MLYHKLAVRGTLSSYRLPQLYMVVPCSRHALCFAVLRMALLCVLEAVSGVLAYSYLAAVAHLCHTHKYRCNAAAQANAAQYRAAQSLLVAYMMTENAVSVAPQNAECQYVHCITVLTCPDKLSLPSIFLYITQVDDLLQGANVYAPGKVLATTALNTGHFNFVPPSKREKLSFPALKVATNRPWLTAGSDHSGVFDQCCGLLVAWMEGVFRKALSTDFGGLFGPGTWTDHQLLEATSTAGTGAATGSGAATSAAVIAAVTTTTTVAAAVV